MPDTIDRFTRSWQLIKASASVLRSDGELLVLPVLSGLATALVAAVFVFQMMDYGFFDSLRDNGELASMGPLYGWLFAFYVVQYFVIIFFNTALVGAAIDRLDGGDPTVGSALAIAIRRIGPIFGYAVISATVGVLLRAFSERTGFIGRLVAGAIGLAWTVATFLVVPILAAEGVGPIEAIEKSVQLLRKSWGENIIGNAGISLIVSSAAAVLILIGAGGSQILAAREAYVSASTLMAVSAVLLLILMVVGSALSAIYAAAVYYFAVLGDPPEGFDQSLIREAFRPKG